MPSLVPPVLLPGSLARHPQPVLTRGDLVLRPWEDGDAPALVAAYADPLVQQWNGDSMTEAEALAYAGEWAAHWQAERRAGWAVVRGDVLVGRTTVRALDLEQASGGVTYWVVPAAHDAARTAARRRLARHAPARAPGRRPQQLRVIGNGCSTLTVVPRAISA